MIHPAWGPEFQPRQAGGKPGRRSAPGGGGLVTNGGIGAGKSPGRRLLLSILILMFAPAARPADPLALDYTAAPEFNSTDWIQVLLDNWNGPRAGVRPMPHDIVLTRAPFLVWPHVGTDATRYQVNLRPIGGSTLVLQPDRPGRNWLDAGDLGSGAYEWRVQHPLTQVWSDWRPFAIAANAVSYVVPSAAALVAHAAARPHPRSTPDDFENRLVRFRAGGDLHPYTLAATANLNSLIGQTLFWENGSGFSNGLLGNQLERIPAFWWLWMIERNPAYRDEARRRLRWFSTPYQPGRNEGFLLSSAGKTSYFNDDIAATNLTRFLAFGWDAMKSLLTSQEQEDLLAAIGFRLHEMTVDLTAYPMRADCLENSHDIVGSMIGALTGLSLIGDAEVSARPALAADVALWAHNADQALKTYNTFADQEGCHWHTLGYASTTFDRAQTLDMLGNIAGVDAFANPRTRGIVEAQMRLFPPDNTGASRIWNKPFGDATVGTPEWGNVLAFEPVYGTAEMARYSQMKAATLKNYAEINEWYIARTSPNPSTAAPLFPAVVYPGAGMGAFHSDPLDRQRTSLWFRSSPEGADNHRHLDQNSFVLSARGTPLFIDAGYYGQYGDDDYGSAHRANFAKRSIAHNTIALDGRTGQQRFYKTGQSVLNEVAARRARGRILRFVDTTDYGFVVGDARPAYQDTGYEHTKALRAVVYLRPHVVLVFDAHDLSGASPSWNWLYHTLTAPVDAAGLVTITAGPAAATIRNLLANPAIVGRVTTNNAWPANADPGVGAPAQWHNSFDFAPAPSLRSCFLIEVKSSNPVTAADCTASGATMTASLTVAGRAWRISFDAASGAVLIQNPAAETAKLVNLSTRSFTGIGSDALIAGFVLAGPQPKPVLVRAVGPTLARFEVKSALAAARLEIFQGATSLKVGTDWGAASDAAALAATAARVGAFALAADSRDAALLLTLGPGSYTAVVSGQNNATGVSLVEVYDATEGPILNAQRLINLSSRATVGSLDATLIGGFYLSGSVPRRVLIRGVGPGLGQFGLTGTLARPQLLLFQGAQLVAQNSGWSTSPDAAGITAAGAQVGAFALAPGSADAALLFTLEPGAYSAQVVGTGGAAGVALVEVYEVP